MTSEDFEFLAQFLRRRSGTVLAPYKSHLIEGRLAPVARRFGFRDVKSLLRELRFAQNTLAQAVTEAMTTNDTAFFRDEKLFEEYRDRILPALVSARSREKHLRIWSTACAAGQEAYSIAMILDESRLAHEGWTIDLIATDLNSDLIARAEMGLFTGYEVERGLSARRLAAHFTRDGANYRISDRLRRMVNFRAFNLLDSYGWLHELDAVFCRNVLIYFEQNSKLQVVEKIADVLAPHGALFLGRAEYIDGLDSYFTRQNGAAGCYAPRMRDSEAGNMRRARVA